MLHTNQTSNTNKASNEEEEIATYRKTDNAAVAMVARFRRSLSLSGGSNRSSAAATAGASRDKSYHTRSTSLPCHSHPAIGHLEEETRSLRAITPPSAPSPAWLADALDRINCVHSALAEFLLHRTGSGLDAARAGPLLDGSLLLADAYASLRSTASALRRHVAEARAAIRRGEPARASAAVRAQRREEKELERLASSVKGLARGRPPAPFFPSGEATEVEIAGLIREAVSATAATSTVIFNGVVLVSEAAASTVTSASRDSSVIRSLRRMSLPRALDKKASPAPEVVPLERMEECAEELEKGSERVYRSLVNTRVALLNIITPSL